MEFWKTLREELARSGFSAELIKQLNKEFQKVDPEDLIYMPADKLVTAASSGGVSITSAQASELQRLAKAVFNRLDAGSRPITKPQPDTVEFTMRLRDAETPGKPGIGHFDVRIERQGTSGKPDVALFVGRADASGTVRFAVPASTASGGVQVRVSGLDNQNLLTQNVILNKHKPEISLDLKVTDYKTRLAAPLNSWQQAVNKSLSNKLAMLFQQNKISSLADLRLHAERLRTTPGLSQAERAEFGEIEAHAHLQLLSRDHGLNQKLIDAGFKDMFAIAGLSRSAFLDKTKSKIDEKTADHLYALTEQKVEILKNTTLDSRVAQANGSSQLQTVQETQLCNCDCQSAVSPLAYLADLLDFVLREITYNNGALTLLLLEELYHQLFAAMPADCSASEESVRQVRICIEVLRRKAVADGKATEANQSSGQHTGRAYDGLLAALGTSSRELRLLRGASEAQRLRKAQSLGIASVHLNSLMLPNENPAPAGTPLSERSLETIFGFQDTTRDPLSFGVKLGDDVNHIQSWQLKGVEWRRNTDESGRIFGRLSKQSNKFTVTLFKDSARTQTVAMAMGDQATDTKPSDLTLEAEHESGLYGRFSISHQAANANFELAVVPQLLIWQLSELIRLWQAEDHSKPDPLLPILPIIDPDLLSKDYFCRPFQTKGAYGLRVRRAEQLSIESKKLDQENNGHSRTVQEMFKTVWSTNLPDWDDIATDLASELENKVKARIGELNGLHLSVDAFNFLDELRRREDIESSIVASGTLAVPLSESEKAERVRQRQQAIDILLNVIKRRDFYPAWLGEETPSVGDVISHSQRYFCIPSVELAPANPLRVTAEQMALWLNAFERNSRVPIVDPDILFPIPNIGASDGPVESILSTRRKQLDDIQAALIALTPVKRTKDWLDDRLGTKDFVNTAGEVLLHGLDLTEIDNLQTAFEGQRLDIQIQQHGLTPRELNALLTLRKLVVSAQADTQDWLHVFHILIQAEKRRYLYPPWLMEEAAKELTLSPQFFRNPTQPLLQLLANDDRPPELIEWRGNPPVLRTWRSQLQARFQQQLSVNANLRTVVDSAEETTLPALRDALIDAVYGDLAAANREQNKKTATNALLINAFENGCRKTTRVAQAIETMQLLIWGILNDQIEDRNFRIPDQNREEFAANWHWLKSYATWRAAMFVFLYPENILLPRLRPQEEQTALFKAIVRILDGTATPSPTESEESENDPAELSVEEELIIDLTNRIFRKLGGKLPSSVEGIDTIRGSIFGLRRSVGDLWVIYQPGEGQVVQKPEAKIENSLYLPLHFALTLQNNGDCESAIKWFRKIFDFNDGELNPAVAALITAQVSSSTRYYNGESWLNDKLNPHLLAATRSDISLRFILISIIRCLLDYAEAEFTTDTPESLARTRELYLTAQRLLDEDVLKQNLPDCLGSIGKLILEVGETYRDRPVIRDSIIDSIIDLGPRITPDLIPEVLKDLGNIVTGLNPQPRALLDIRRNIKALLQKHIPKSAPVLLAGRINGIGIKRNQMLRQQLKNGQVFDQIQQVGTDLMRAGTTPRSFSALGIGNTVAAARSIPGRGDLVARDTRIKIPGVVFEFCIPPNPILIGLRLRTETGLFKLSHCMNLAGLRREVPAYAVPTDTRSGMPGIGVSGALSLPQAVRHQSTQYRYKVLVERAKQLVGIAQQMEATYLSFMDKLEQESYSVLQARHDLGLANASVTLQSLRVTEAEHGKDLAKVQTDRVDKAFEYYENLIEVGKSSNEVLSIKLLEDSIVLLNASAAASSVYAAAVYLVAAGLIGGTGVAGWSELGSSVSSFASAASARASALSTTSSIASMSASFERREQEWKFQKDLANIDKLIAEVQKTLAQDRYNIVEQEQTIAKIVASNAEDVLNFLSNKFTNADLYNWMSGIIGGVYRYFLEQSTAMAKLAQIQLAFERQEAGLDFILSDYWTLTTGNGSLGAGAGEGSDRRGMTGSARLLHDLYRMDQHAFTTDRRKLQMSKSISLAMHDPISFQLFKETGVLPFVTRLELFDRDFPGHYLRLIKRVRASVIALIPPVQGVKATLSNTGISHVVIGTQSGSLFEERDVRREPESVALTATINDGGVFELQDQPDMLLPFEGLGVAGSWEFRLPKAANAFEFRTIADVQITIEYTALDSTTHRQQVIQQLDRSISADRPFSFRQQFSDAWYDLHNPDLVQAPQMPLEVSFSTRREDFPPNVADLKIEHVTLYFALKSGVTDEINILHLHFTEQGKVGVVGSAATTVDGIASTGRGNAGGWTAMLGKTPLGEWTLALEDKPEIRQLLDDDLLEDILFVITFGGTTPEWPD